MSGGLIALIILVVVGVTSGIYVQLRWHRRKDSGLKALAARHGWRYAVGDGDIVGRFQGAPFDQSRSKRARYVVTGEHRGRRLTAFEWNYTETRDVGSGSSVEIWYTVVVVTTPAARPTLQVSREPRYRLGRRDLQLESERFNQTFLIDSANDRFAYDVLHPRMMEWLLSNQRALSTPFRFEGDGLVVWRPGMIKPDTVLWLLDYGCDILDRVPGFVWQSRQEGGST